MTSLRGLDTVEMDGFTNIEADKALREAFVPCRSWPSLRVYRWSGSSLSVGRFQKSAHIDWEGCLNWSIRLMRRPAGGTSLLRDRELTYSLIASERDYSPAFHGSHHCIDEAVTSAMDHSGVDNELGHCGERGEGLLVLLQLLQGS